MGSATTCAKQKTGADVRLRDSVALRESYDSYYRHLEEERYEFVFMEIATPSWEHDRQLMRIGRIRRDPGGDAEGVVVQKRVMFPEAEMPRSPAIISLKCLWRRYLAVVEARELTVLYGYQ
jgi:hypothetical protein